MSRPPRVLVTCDRRDGGPPAVGTPRVRPKRAEAYVNEAIVRHVRCSGAQVLLVPAGDPDPEALLDMADAIVVTGGAHDIHPRHYGQAVHARIDRVDDARADMELALLRACAARDLPVLGLCGGMQALAVALGGTLLQDIRTARPDALDHEQPDDPALPGHEVRAWGPLAGRVGPGVNSTHHQAVDATGPLEVCAVAPDGVIEALYLPGHRFAVGVQWHPELLGLDVPGARPDPRLFEALVEAARR